MSNSIDKIIEELKQKLNYTYTKEVSDLPLSDEQLAIKKFLDERRIHYLIHFTDAKNIASIKENGILSIEELKKRGLVYIRNDENRHDNAPDYISLSVSGINQYLYRTFKNINQTIEHGVAVIINAELLYKEIDTSRIYCNTNAATATSNKGEALKDLEVMFSDTVEYITAMGVERKIDRNVERRASYESTDIQAEILWNKRVPPEYIMFYWDLEEDFFYGD